MKYTYFEFWFLHIFIAEGGSSAVNVPSRGVSAGPAERLSGIYCIGELVHVESIAYIQRIRQKCEIFSMSSSEVMRFVLTDTRLGESETPEQAHNAKNGL